jgi:hypothetical protein
MQYLEAHPRTRGAALDVDEAAGVTAAAASG